jgi:hypothetical protein
MKILEGIQFVWWYKFHIRFIKGNPLKNPAAFHLIYKWSLWLGFLEIRKFMNLKEMGQAMMIYTKNTNILE